jgi:hypothetical protein
LKSDPLRPPAAPSSATLLITFMRNSEIVISFKTALVQKFYEMRALLTPPAKPLTHGEMLLAQCQMLVDQERRLAATEDKIRRIEAKQEAFEEGSKYFTVIGYAVWKGMPALSLSEASSLGKKAAMLSRERGALIDKVRDPRFGIVNSYHQDVLDEIFCAEMAA